MKLASIERIHSVEKHPNADKLSICGVLGYRAITKLNQFKIGDLVVFIQPDCVLPNKDWAAFYKAKSNRTKAIRLRGFWSEGIIESLENLGLSNLEIGTEVSEIIGVTKYEPPIPQDLNAKCALRFGLTKTDEERFNNLELIPYGEEVIVTLKIDGQSATYGCVSTENGLDTFITSRSLELKPECINNYTLIEKKYDILNKIVSYIKNDGNYESFCLRGEIYGSGIQSFACNPHSKLPLNFAVFNLMDFKTGQYVSFEECIGFCEWYGLPYVPVIERTILTPELIKKYSEDLTEINGNPFEGVVIKLKNGQSFKVINKFYDSNK